MITESEIASVVERALEEDLGSSGDLTSKAVIPEDAVAEGDIVVRQAGVIAGIDVAKHVFHSVDPTVEYHSEAKDGDHVGVGTIVAGVAGRARSILTAERTALNLMGRMSGVATATARYVEAVAGTGARVTDTRKTMPGLRALDKYAVVLGGGVNHRMGLHDAVMIKDNHLIAGLPIGEAVDAARAAVGPDVEVTVEVENLDQLRRALASDADRIMLDNMDPTTIRQAVGIIGGKKLVEASGGVTEDSIREIAETGVDLISVGWITHSVPQLDIALDFRW